MLLKGQWGRLKPADQCVIQKRLVRLAPGVWPPTACVCLSLRHIQLAPGRAPGRTRGAEQHSEPSPGKIQVMSVLGLGHP